MFFFRVFSLKVITKTEYSSSCSTGFVSYVFIYYSVYMFTIALHPGQHLIWHGFLTSSLRDMKCASQGLKYAFPSSVFQLGK